MNKENCKTMATKLLGDLARKVAASAVNAAVFAYVSKKVSDLLDRQAEKNKVRVDTAPQEASKTGS